LRRRWWRRVADSVCAGHSNANPHTYPDTYANSDADTHSDADAGD
jgi:hypothetical protein